MKKVLFATTALVATASVAAADVSFGGFGRFGLQYNEQPSGSATDEVTLEQRFRLTITGTTETDGGVKFEGRIRFQSDDDGATGAGQVSDNSAAGFAVSAGGLRVDVGHVSDVLDSGDVVDYYGYGVGLTSHFEQSSNFSLPASGFGTSGDDDDQIDPTIKVRYATGDFTVAASLTDGADDGSREEYQIGFGYNFAGFSAGVAFGNEDDGVDDADFWAASLGGALGPVDFSLLVADYDAPGISTAWGVSAKYDLSAATQLRAVYNDDGSDDDENAYGIGFQHSLGGGVSLRGSYGEKSGADHADLGVVFNF